MTTVEALAKIREETEQVRRLRVEGNYLSTSKVPHLAESRLVLAEALAWIAKDLEGVPEQNCEIALAVAERALLRAAGEVTDGAQNPD